MKKMKRLVALALSVVMVLAMSVFASAATVNVTVPEDMKDHTFVAYQIFTGTQASDSGELGDVKWGTGINETNFLADLKAETSAVKDIFASCTDAKSVAAALGTVDNNTDEAKAVAKIALANKKGEGQALTKGENTLESGYYLIVDTTTTTGKDDASNAALLQVTNNIQITKKTDKPSVEKKVKENTKYDQDGGYGTDYNDVADYNMGDDVPFHLIGTVPDMSNYDTYKYIFHDTLSEGLTAPAEGEIKVYLSSDKTKDDSDVDVTDDFTITVSGQTITVTCNDLKKIKNIKAGQYIIVEYSAKLNQNAVVGLDGNENKVNLEYSNNPDQSGEGDTDNTGKTPDDKVIVFTYKLDVTKVDGENSNTKLQGAEFKLRNSDGKWAVVTDGKVTGWSDTEAGGSTLTSDEDGLFHVTGLDDGTYYLKETKAPAGYNVLTDEITLVVAATTTNNQNWSEIPSDALTKIDVTVNGGTATDGDVNNGTVSVTVENNKGSQLPSTGGIGTTIFYVIGGILMVGAAVLLITKRRAEN